MDQSSAQSPPAAGGSGGPNRTQGGAATRAFDPYTGSSQTRVRQQSNNKDKDPGTGKPVPIDGFCCVAPSSAEPGAHDYLYVHAPRANKKFEEIKAAHDSLVDPAAWRNSETSFLSGYVVGFKLHYFKTKETIDRITGKPIVPAPWGVPGTKFQGVYGSCAMRMPIVSSTHAQRNIADIRTLPPFQNLPALSIPDDYIFKKAEVTIIEVDKSSPEAKYICIHGEASYAFQHRLKERFGYSRVAVTLSNFNGWATVSDFGEEYDLAALLVFFEEWGIRVTFEEASHIPDGLG